MFGSGHKRKPRTFEAMYEGFCYACGDDIEPGDQIAYNEDDEIVHGDCLE